MIDKIFAIYKFNNIISMRRPIHQARRDCAAEARKRRKKERKKKEREKEKENYLFGTWLWLRRE